jgi:hypothetical protein
MYINPERPRRAVEIANDGFGLPSGLIAGS